MPRGKKITTIETEIGEAELTSTPASSHPELTDEQIAEQSTIQAFIGAFGNEASKVLIYKFDRAMNQVYQGQGELGAVDEEYIQEQYGDGKYLVRLADGKGRFIKSRTIYIGMTKDSNRGAPMHQIPGSPVIVNQPAPAGFTPEIEALRQQVAMLQDLTLKLIEKQNGSAGQQTTLQELVAAIAAMKEMNAPASPVSAISEIISVLKQGIELGASGGLPEKPAWYGIVKEIAEAAGPMLQNLRAAKTAPVVTPAVPAKQVEGEAAMQLKEREISLLKMGLNYLKPKARAGKDVDLWIDFIVDNLEDEQWGRFASAFNDPYEEIAKHDADLLTPLYRPWFEALYVGVRNAIANGTVAGQTGDAANAAENGAVS